MYSVAIHENLVSEKHEGVMKLSFCDSTWKLLQANGPSVRGSVDVLDDDNAKNTERSYRCKTGQGTNKLQSRFFHHFKSAHHLSMHLLYA